MKKGEKYFFIISIIAVPLIIFFYFLKWKTTTISGDDLYIFKDHFARFSEREAVTKFRPVSNILVNLFFDLFKKDLNDYYYFNIGIQVIDTYIFALILNLFLKSPWLSVIVSLIVGLSRFSIYNISQLFNGGALEGLALGFFLLSLYFILRAIPNNNSPKKVIERSILWSILFANLSMYTHERYIVLFPFIIFVLLFFPGLNTLSRKQKISLSIIPLASVLLNVALKKYVLSIPFFVGTGGTNISFSFSSALSFFTNAVSSIFQVNSGPEYLVGVPYASLPHRQKQFAGLLIFGLIFTLVVYTLNARRHILKNGDQKTSFYTFLFLSVLFIFCLIPAVVTIRLEQRWLQASLAVFIIMIVIALNSLPFKNIFTKNAVFIVFTFSFLCSDRNYCYKGTPDLYMYQAQKTAGIFKQAIANGTIRPETSRLYLFESHIDTNTNNEVKWALAGGYFFNYYQNKSKKIIFTDTIHQRSAYTFELPFTGFNKDSAQILYYKNRIGITDITDQYLKDSLKTFNYP